MGMARLEYFWFIYNNGVIEDLYEVLRPSDNVAFLAENKLGQKEWKSVVNQTLSDTLDDLLQTVEQYRTTHGSMKEAGSEKQGVCTHTLKEGFVDHIQRHLTVSVSCE